ncbi:MAG TPA: hypothetical protein VFD50_02190 [Thermoleophilia bacterium]|nr:hypothetical protein [Thermoleophilia bacterium]
MAPAASSSSSAATTGRKPWVYALWYVESCLAFAAVWALVSDRTPRTFLDVAAFLLLCGAALTVPAHALRAALLRAGAAVRLRVLEVFLVLAAGGAAAALSTARGWAAIVCILLVGNALWALEMESRAAKRGRGVTS